ncbi:SCO5389 family protein [Actinocorallia sp. API 0066]|uniref:SCO5389 family protein n=1 Tax=Actinocorallia sp. API 0066 TaxID=2896846 RepID=UPI001E2C4096|nr:SCO5389 family protein [Actinocorallia sp. API 0066]MCD0448899.1 SCO5389 family protein [Actinocorallia sp. API 0066]
MSLTVSPELVERARDGEVDDAAFLACVRESLPYAWGLVSEVVERLRGADASVQFADNQVPPPDEAARGQLLRALASDAMRGAMERHFGVRLAFQNCHRVAAFRLDAHEALARFTSPRAQLLNQSPELVDC